MVVYLVCMDLSKSTDEQHQQLSYWLEFLNSSLSPYLGQNSSLSKWKILIVGLRADKSSVAPGHTMPCESWQREWPQLPIANEMLAISTHASLESVRRLLEVVKVVCNNIFNLHSVRIPTTYRVLLHSIKTHNSVHHGSSTLQLLSTDDLVDGWNAISLSPSTEADLSLNIALKYLHAIGHIVLLPNKRICADPAQVPRIAAKFISPDHVQLQQLQREATIHVYDETHIGRLLGIAPNASSK